ncbi:hypothetical protein [Rhizobium ruizarguesonis]|uniref:Uncharacterized protein n=1 Tax=Rhizobium ruizarguesonis TaxID=2081791 RepID=A0AAE8Q3G9_9HYPH|nr:hypothetical protein [Rhizobium ruizarguesonis]TBC12709.1 hypothetical protein ELH35_38050 [Rhizobium ruizarguesonis]TBF00955.1 hypothetical protein ELG94_39465 [Rhizobium ruizarguesonis]TCA23662.1 hypothetical protein E0H66_36280 [Rhizobium leguminosarum bv. viciae]
MNLGLVFDALGHQRLPPSPRGREPNPPRLAYATPLDRRQTDLEISLHGRQGNAQSEGRVAQPEDDIIPVVG